MKLVRNFYPSLFFLSLLLLPLGSCAVTTGDSIIAIGVLLFLGLMSVIFVASGFFLIRDKMLKMLGVLLIFAGFGFLYGATSMANIYLMETATTIGGGAVFEGLFVWFARLMGYSFWIIVAGVLYSLVNLFRGKKREEEGADGWDNNNFGS